VKRDDVPNGVQRVLYAVRDIVAFHDDALARAQQADYRFTLLLLEQGEAIPIPDDLANDKKTYE